MEEINQEEVVTDEVVELAEEVAAEVKDVRDTFDETLEKVNADQDALRIDIEKRTAELFQKEVAFTLKESGLEMFADIINVSDADELDATVIKLNQIVADLKVSMSYQPKDNAKQDEYTVHVNNKDTKSMIGNKLANLFK
ncbi:hypothetical protein [Sporosarcina limicola]|uniref:Uncharacterized protein n=1 Tax=Sporosarcina limicola TaxID=34101 RepID=A0A927MMG3_9BACL|nr:hypothetical protein [Sporosarcina limicola]MBE1557035.1 hypothetical protein [Sporosarcina limicola]